MQVLDSWARPLRDGNERMLNGIASLLLRRHVVDMLAVVLVLAVGVHSLFGGYDLWRLINGDTVFPVHVLSFAPLEYRPPPSSGLFPDVLVHLLVAPFIPDPLWQKLVVGWLLIFATVIVTGSSKGPFAAFAVIGLFSLSGFEYVDSTSHFSLPLMLLMYQLARPVWLKHLLLLLIAFSDVLIVLPLIVLFLSEDDQPPVWQSVLIAGFGSLAGEVLYSELSLSLLQISVVIPIFAMGSLIAKRFGLLKLMCVGFGVLLVIGAASGLLSGRYAYPVAACLLLVYLPTQPWRLDWRYVVLPAALMGVFAGTANAFQLRADTAQLECFLDELQVRDIDAIAVDHWMSKPLDMAARARGQSLSIAQVDFSENTTDLWMAPYDFAGEPTLFALRNPRICSITGNMDDFCAQDRVAPVSRVETVCSGLELYTYAELVPSNFVPRPENKWQSIGRNISHYLGKIGFSSN